MSKTATHKFQSAMCHSNLGGGDSSSKNQLRLSTEGNQKENGRFSRQDKNAKKIYRGFTCDENLNLLLPAAAVRLPKFSTPASKTTDQREDDITID